MEDNETVDKSSHIWDNYELSAEIIAMAPAKRKSIFGDYDAELTGILEEKFRSSFTCCMRNNEDN